MRKIAASITIVLTALLIGCESVKKRTDNAELETGMRFDEDGRFTDKPELKVPIWKSRGLKEKPKEVTPPRR